MGAGATHKDLVAWQLAMELVQVVYRDTLSLPSHETFGLTAQMRRAAYRFLRISPKAPLVIHRKNCTSSLAFAADRLRSLKPSWSWQSGSVTSSRMPLRSP
jgi:hypothetical protein